MEFLDFGKVSFHPDAYAAYLCVKLSGCFTTFASFVVGILKSIKK